MITQGTDQPGSTFPNYEFPLAPKSVLHAYEQFWRVTREPGRNYAAKQRAMTETNVYIADFCDTRLTPQVYSAAMLADMTDSLDDTDRALNATRGLRIYYEQSPEAPEDKQYILGLLTDRYILHQFREEQIHKLYTSDSERLALLTDQTNTQPVPKATWYQKPLGPDPEQLFATRTEQGVNIESYLIAASQTLQWLHSPAAGNNSATLQKIYSAEAFYAPICEVIGFDGLAMALQSRCLELRLINRGEGEYVERAREIIRAIGGDDPKLLEQRVQTMLNGTVGDTVHELVLTHMMPHGIILGDGIEFNNEHRIIWRLKSLGSLARKLTEHKSNQPPMDVIGATIITTDATEIGQSLRDILTRVSNDPRVRLVPSQSRDKCLHAKGSPAYIDSIREAMGYKSLEAMKRDVDVVPSEPGGHQVAKITLTFQSWGDETPLPSEIQFNTEADRRDARIGSPSHAFHKLYGKNSKLSPRQIAAVSDFHDQNEHLGQNSLTAKSRERARELEAMILTVG